MQISWKGLAMLTGDLSPVQLQALAPELKEDRYGDDAERAFIFLAGAAPLKAMELAQGMAAKEVTEALIKDAKDAKKATEAAHA